jgi:hypothetical protein
MDNRATTRRRGRRADELVAAVSDDPQDGIASAAVEDVEAEDVLLPTAPAWPISQPMPAVWVAHDRASLLAPHGSGRDRAPQPIDPLADAVVAAHMLSSRGDDSAGSSSDSRQSA